MLTLRFEDGSTRIAENWSEYDKIREYRSSRFPFEVVASGRDLDFIRSTFSRIPDAPDATEVRWYGDIARFIVANL